MVVVTDITTGQIATLINAGITIVQATLGLALVVVLVYTMNNANSAISWSAVARRLHSSLWPTLLRTDSAISSGNAGIRMVTILTFLGALLLAVSGIVTPLGLKDGPIVLSKPTLMNASYVADTSPVGLATPPRELYTYGRICGGVGPVACPRNGNNGNTTVIAPSILETFSSTSHGPFNMQFRRYYPGISGYGYQATKSDITLVQSFILRNDIFAIEGLIVDLTDNPGIGLWNHTFPSLEKGGTWEEDVLWLEPVTACVDTNLTIDYKIDNEGDSRGFSLTDRGGIVNLTTEYPEYSLDGQHIDIRAHAYKGAVISISLLMHGLNITRNESYIGRQIPFNDSESFIQLGKVQFPAGLLSNNTKDDDTVLCQGYGGRDTANITNVATHCFMILGPPVRTDGGDQRFSGPNTTWTQNLHYCAATTRARIQTITFSFNGTSRLQDLQISRKNVDRQFLWAMEKSDIKITDIDTFWGRVTDSYENDPKLWTTRSDMFYVPAGGSDVWGVTAAGQPTTVIGAAWYNIYNQVGNHKIDYSGANDYALLTKWQLNVRSDPVNGLSRMSNWIWTDLMANNLMGNATSATVIAARRHATVAYDYKYAIPAFILLALWAPTFLAAICILLMGAVKLESLRYLLNQTSAGRLAVGDSNLAVIDKTSRAPPGNGEQSPTHAEHSLAESGDHTKTSQLPTSLWSKTAGQTVIGLVPAPEERGGQNMNVDSSNGEINGNSDFRRRRLKNVLKDMIQTSLHLPGNQTEKTSHTNESD